MNEQEYSYLTQRILSLTSIDLSCYKSQQMRRRLDAFIASRSPDVTQYCSVLGQDKAALKKLKDFLTINVSEFFRDREQFDLFRTRYFPELRRHTQHLNIWSAGCSHGAEPYSMAIILEEMFPGQHHRILATDIDEGAIATARDGGPYKPADIQNVNGMLNMKYFIKSDSGYKVVDSLRRKVEFRQHNMLKDPFERGFDLIVCRNVMIYFSDIAKSSLIRMFSRSLKDEGILFIGATEMLLSSSDFGLERLSAAFYRKAAAGSAARPREESALPGR